MIGSDRELVLEKRYQREDLVEAVSSSSRDSSLRQALSCAEEVGGGIEEGVSGTLVGFYSCCQLLNACILLEAKGERSFYIVNYCLDLFGGICLSTRKQKRWFCVVMSTGT
ncbi:hypothetical protein BaRGS_00025871 [Batillaria attramentaria]|uniref:Uncharacterized protein n=1 Tax=Batillaria attramentaria TaxID=370345 RepID=A0ABD0K6T4_9CAEN